MTCEECGRPLWDSNPPRRLCESCSDRAQEERHTYDFEHEQVEHPFLHRRNPGEYTARRLRDIPRGY